MTGAVFGRTGSAAWAAATYALTFLPALVGGLLLGRLADHHPRRRVMVVCDLARALLVALMALPGTSLSVLSALRRVLVCAAWLMGCLVLPEALAVPYAERLGLGTVAAGLLVAADPAGSVVGAWLFTRYLPERLRRRGVGPLAVTAALPLGLCGAAPEPGVTLVLQASRHCSAVSRRTSGARGAPSRCAARSGRRSHSSSPGPTCAPRCPTWVSRSGPGSSGCRGDRACRAAGRSPRAVRHRDLLPGRRHDRSNATHLVAGAADRPPTDRRSPARAERR